MSATSSDYTSHDNAIPFPSLKQAAMVDWTRSARMWSCCLSDENKSSQRVSAKRLRLVDGKIVFTYRSLAWRWRISTATRRTAKGRRRVAEHAAAVDC